MFTYIHTSGDQSISLSCAIKPHTNASITKGGVVMNCNGRVRS